jgi:hypothetical protein
MMGGGGVFLMEGDKEYMTWNLVYDSGRVEATIVIIGGSGSYQDASGSVESNLCLWYLFPCLYYLLLKVHRVCEFLEFSNIFASKLE